MTIARRAFISDPLAVSFSRKSNQQAFCVRSLPTRPERKLTETTVLKVTN